MSLTPTVGVPADRCIVGPHPFHIVGEKYLRAVVEGAGGLPLMVPALGGHIDRTHMLETMVEYEPVTALLAGVNGRLSQWSPLAQAQYLEVATFMSPYLLSSQGDRMMAANSVEGRFPFLDHRVVEFCNRLLPRFKLRGLQEKLVLRRGLCRPRYNSAASSRTAPRSIQRCWVLHSMTCKPISHPRPFAQAASSIQTP